MIVLGVDPGKMGCVVALDGEQALVLPSWAEYVSGGEYNPALMPDVLLRWGRPSMVAIERQHAMPRQGATSGFTTGYGFGLWVGLCAGLGLPYRVVRASEWHRGLGVEASKDKDKAVLKARVQAVVMAALPGLDAPNAKAKREAVCDAAGIALWARRVK